MGSQNGSSPLLRVSTGGGPPCVRKRTREEGASAGQEASRGRQGIRRGVLAKAIADRCGGSRLPREPREHPRWPVLGVEAHVWEWGERARDVLDRVCRDAGISPGTASVPHANKGASMRSTTRAAQLAELGGSNGSRGRVWRGRAAADRAGSHSGSRPSGLLLGRVAAPARWRNGRCRRSKSGLPWLCQRPIFSGARPMRLSLRGGLAFGDGRGQGWEQKKPCRSRADVKKTQS